METYLAGRLEAPWVVGARLFLEDYEPSCSCIKVHGFVDIRWEDTGLECGACGRRIKPRQKQNGSQEKQEANSKR